MQTENYVLRPLLIAGGLLGLYTGVSNIFNYLPYTSTLVCFYLSFFSIVIVTSSISRFLNENYYFSLFPFLAQPLSKGIFVVVIASLCFGGEMGQFGVYSGIALFAGGVGYVIIASTQPKEKEFKSEKIFFENTGYQPPNLA